MVYVRKGAGSRKYGAKKGSKNYKKSYKSKSGISKRSALVSLIKKVSLQQVETKHAHFSAENYQLFHNSANINGASLYLTQGVGDNGSGTNNNAMRIGDEVIGRGIAFKFWIANKLDRPNVMYRLMIFKYTRDTPLSLGNLLKGAISNNIMDDANTEKIDIVYQKIFNLQVGYSAAATGTAGDTDGREAHRYLKCYIPLKNRKIHYNDGGTDPKFFDYGFALIAYDSYGTLITDNIGSFAWERKFYFKDP